MEFCWWVFCRGQRSGDKTQTCILRAGRLNWYLEDWQRNLGKCTREECTLLDVLEGKSCTFGSAWLGILHSLQAEARIALGTPQVPGQHCPPSWHQSWIPSVPFLRGSHTRLPRSSPVCLMEADARLFTPRA